MTTRPFSFAAFRGLPAFGFLLRHCDLDFGRTSPATESGEPFFSVTAAGVTVRNLKVRKTAGRINLPTTSQSASSLAVTSHAAESILAGSETEGHDSR
jgi:hypothetical protein